MLSQRLEVSVRNACPSDAPAIARIFQDSWRLAYSGIIPALHLEREIRRRDSNWWRRAVAAERHLLVILHGESIAGYASCGRARGGSRRDTGEIYELYIAPVYQGIGLGEHLFEVCRAILDDLGLEHLIVWALAENDRARAFYLRCGGRPARRSCVNFGKAVSTRIAFEW
jgi:GNAT superfamily N-acetyltransferase